MHRPAFSVFVFLPTVHCDDVQPEHDVTVVTNVVPLHVEEVDILHVEH